MLSVPVLPSKSARAWPEHADGARASYFELSAALDRRYTTDAHFAAYSMPAIARRLARGAPEQAPEGVRMVAAVFDVDGAGHAASDDWREAERAKVAELQAAHPGVLMYETRGGYRVVAALPTPIIIRDDEDRASWRRLYLHWCAYLSRRFGLVADPACADWTRLYRLPHATRDEGGQPEDLPVVGDLANIGPWTYFPVGAERLAGVEEARRLAQLQPAWDGVLKHIAPAPARPRPAGQAGVATAAAGEAYTRAALKREIGRVRCAAESTRNQTLNTAAYNLGQLVGAGALDRVDVTRELEAAAHDAGLDEHEIMQTIKCGLDAGEERPRELPTPKPGHAPSGAAQAATSTGEPPPDEAGDPGAGEESEPRAPAAGSRPNLTDLGNAQRLVAEHGRDLRHVTAWDEWLVWSGSHWKRDETGEVMRLAATVPRMIDREAAQEHEEERRKALRSWANKSEMRARLEAAVALARSMAGVAVTPAVFDADPWLLTVANGTLDLRNGRLRPHRREELITKMAPVAFNAAACCPRWEQFLTEILPSPELRAFVQRMAGYFMTGDTAEHAFFVLWGEGANGKSTFVEPIMEILGDYAMSTRADTLLLKRNHDGAKASPDVARLRAARFIACNETPSGARLDEALVKELTGGDTITARFLFSEFFDFRPIFKIALRTNYKPTIRGVDAGIWRRMRLVPFTVKIPEERRDKRLADQLRRELPGILAWAVRGCLAYQRDGLGSAPEVDGATAAYREEQDPLGGFLADCCHLSERAWTPTTELRKAYAAWCERDSEEPLSSKAFGAALVGRGCVARARYSSGHKARGWEGIGLGSVPFWEPANPPGDEPAQRLGTDRTHRADVSHKSPMKGDLGKLSETSARSARSVPAPAQRADFTPDPDESHEQGDLPLGTPDHDHDHDQGQEEWWLHGGRGGKA